MIDIATEITGRTAVKGPGGAAVAPTWSDGSGGDIDRDDNSVGVAENAGAGAFFRIDGVTARS